MPMRGPYFREKLNFLFYCLHETVLFSQSEVISLKNPAFKRHKTYYFYYKVLMESNLQFFVRNDESERKLFSAATLNFELE